jgi:hypothetical protein
MMFPLFDALPGGPPQAAGKMDDQNHSTAARRIAARALPLR